LRLTMLGTGNALVTECYNTCFVIEDEGKYFMVDGGGGSAVLRQLKHAGFNWMDMRHIFVTHKHVDHLIGIIWMVRMICQFMNHDDYKGEAYIYSHKEVLEIIKEMADKLLLKKETRFIGDRLHLVEVHDGETIDIIGHATTFFDIQSTKANQFVFAWIWEMVRSLLVVETNHIQTVKRNMPGIVSGFYMRLFVCILSEIFLIHMRSITLR